MKKKFISKILNTLINILFLSSSIIIPLILFEFIYSRTEEKPVYAKFKRSIRLREHPPSRSISIIPSDIYLSNSDNLEKKPYRIRTDEESYIMPSTVHENPDHNIIFLGGSTTECLFLEENDRFPYLVGRALEKKIDQKFNTFNSGVSGNNSMHSINIFLNKGLKLRPKIAVMLHSSNDLTSMLHMRNYWGKSSTRSLIVSESNTRLNHRSITYRIRNLFPHNYAKLQSYLLRKSTRDEFVDNRGKGLEVNKELLLNDFSSSLQSFIDVSKAWNVEPVLMTMMNRLKSNPDKIIEDWLKSIDQDFDLDYGKYRLLFKEFNQVVRDLGKKNNILVIDLAKEVPKTSDYMHDYVHLTKKGSRFVSETIANKLSEKFFTENQNDLK